MLKKPCCLPSDDIWVPCCSQLKGPLPNWGINGAMQKLQRLDLFMNLLTGGICGVFLPDTPASMPQLLSAATWQGYQRLTNCASLQQLS